MQSARVSRARGFQPVGLIPLHQVASRNVASHVNTPNKTTTGTTSSSKKVSFDGEKFVKDIQARWEAVDDKGSVAVYSVGALTLLFLSSSLVGAINRLPVLPKLMELVGLGYTSWFVYRYLLFKESREELISDIEDLKKKIAGDNATAPPSSGSSSGKPYL